MPPTFFDAHLDLAYIAVAGRDMTSPFLDHCGGPDLPAAVTLPTLAAGNVRVCLATVFTEMNGSNAASYPEGDVQLAHRRGIEQLEVYRTWIEHGVATSMFAANSPHGNSPLRLGILVEGADPIRSPDELPFWLSQGVVAIGLAWVHGSRYAGGNSQNSGLTDLGRAMVRAMDQSRVVHDLSHLSDASMDELLSISTGRVIASHSNCRALFQGEKANNQRHLRDDSIREIVRRGGIIGLNLFSPFINPDASRERRASLDDACRHIEHVCELAGHRRAVGLGSDMDGGFSANMLPETIDRPEHLHRLLGALAARGWSNDDLDAFAWGNWARFWNLLN